jgi:hypothetical protein
MPLGLNPSCVAFSEVGVQHEIDLLVVAVERLVDTGIARRRHAGAADRPASRIAATRRVRRVLDRLGEARRGPTDRRHDLLLIDTGAECKRQDRGNLEPTPCESRYRFVRLAPHDSQTIGNDPDRDAVVTMGTSALESADDTLVT